MGRATELSHRSDLRELKRMGDALSWQDLLQAESEAAAWRLVEAFSQDGRPFQLALSWSAGAGSGARARLTVAHSTRVCLFARALTLRTANLAREVNRVGVTVADGFAPTRNLLEVGAESTGESPVVLAVPPFALAVHIDLGDRHALPGSVVALYDGAGVKRGEWSGSSQPEGGISLGGAGRIEVTTQAAVALRGIFLLSL